MNDLAGGGGVSPAGDSRANAELSYRLRRALADKGMRQSDLAGKAEVSKGTVSNALNPDKGVPSQFTLEQLARVLGIGGDSLRELYRLRAEATTDLPTQLRAYLSAAQRAAREHPYPGVLPGIAPPLAAIYLHQRVRHQARADGTRWDTDDRWEDASTGTPPTPEPASALSRAQLGPPAAPGVPAFSRRASADERLSADELLALQGTCLVTAGPGGGKSSLLRTLLETGVGDFLQGLTPRAAPVLVPAAALPGRPLAGALAAAVNADLSSHGLLEEIRPEFFLAPPSPGVPWLILVDGLDEITSASTRHEVLRAVSAVINGKDAGQYRFIIASRPLPDAEIDATLGAKASRFDLQPFSFADLQQVARNWFGHFDLPDPDSVAEQFMRALTAASLADLARIPLMASILCQLHAVAPDQPLPASRGQIYSDFISLLYKRQHAAGASGVRAQARVTLQGYGGNALAHTEGVLDRLPDVIARLAAGRYSGDTRPTMAVVMAQAETSCPPGVPRDEWHAVLKSALQRSGLMTTHAGELVFLHQTLLEYLAARHACRSPASRARTLEKAFTHVRWQWPWSADALGSHRRLTPRRLLIPPHGDDNSYIGFLIDVAQEQDLEATGPYLQRLAADGNIEGCRFLAEQAQLGTTIPTSAARAAAESCTLLASRPALRGYWRLEAAKILTRIDHLSAIDLCIGLAEDQSIRSDWRLQAAEMATDIDNDRGASVLAALAADPTVHASARLHAARSVIRYDKEHAADLLVSLASNHDLSRASRVNAAERLAELDPPRAEDVCAALLENTALPPYLRIAILDVFTQLGDQLPEELYDPTKKPGTPSDG
ncbi:MULTISPECIES: helix-turn-helix domain-containing protein [unclassified Streptomyces]|uniref:helix-turn-helix domain-containing protein n=1 Tax=unclassified Streptomyces TaxID=2593676 RepID=UPI00324E7085